MAGVGAAASFRPAPVLRLRDIKVRVAGRPRPVFAKLTLSRSAHAGIFVDIPTTFSVMADFARFFAAREIGDSPGADAAVTGAREAVVAASQTDQFSEVLNEFTDVANPPRVISPGRRVTTLP